MEAEARRKAEEMALAKVASARNVKQEPAYGGGGGGSVSWGCEWVASWMWTMCSFFVLAWGTTINILPQGCIYLDLLLSCSWVRVPSTLNLIPSFVLVVHVKLFNYDVTV